MPNNIKISEMAPAEELNTTDLLMISQQDDEVETEYDTKSTSVAQLAGKIATGVQFASELDTDSKTIAGAINEAAAVGKKSDGYTSDSFESEDYPNPWTGSPCWINSGETVEGHTVYKSDAGTYGKQTGDSLCRFLVSGYDDVTVYVKQDNTDTNRSYMLLGYANTEVSKRYYAECYQDETLTNYVYHQYNYLNGKPTKIEALYHVDAPTVPGSVSIDLQNGQWIDSGETVGGNTVYKSHGGSYHISGGSSKCIIEISGVSSFSIFCKPSSESGYDKTYIGKLDTTVSKDDSSTYINSFSGTDDYTEIKYEINDENRHTIEILYAKDGGGNYYDDCGYIYFVKNGAPNEDRGYIYIVPGTPHTPLGEVFNDYTNNRALGNYSHAEGSHSYAYGDSSHVEGYGTEAIGPKAHAEGSGTRASYDYAHAEGNITKATNHAAHAEGNGTLAAGSNSHAEGDYTQALYDYAHAEGEYSIARGSASHAEGHSTTASEQDSHAEGYQTIASGRQAHAEGYEATASGYHSHAEGYNTIASGEDSHAEGYHSQALGNYCHAEGYENVASFQGAHAEGSRNVASKLNSHAEGETTKAIGVGAHSEGGYTTASGKYSHAEGSNLNYNTEGPIASGVGAHAEGILTKAEGMGAHAEGMPAIKYQEYSSTATYNTDDIIYYFTSQDNSSTVLNFARAKVNNIQGISPEDNGAWQYWDSYSPSDLSSYFYSDGNGHYSSTAIGKGAHAEGMLAIASGDGSHAEGRSTVASSEGSHAEGGFTSATAYFGHAEGYYTEASGNFAHAEGFGNSNTHNIASGQGSHVEGSQNKASGDFSHTEGQFSHASGQSSHAEGGGTYAYGDHTHTEGAGTRAYGSKSHAEGAGTETFGVFSHVEGAGNVILGSYGHMEGAGNASTGSAFNTHTEGGGNYNYSPQGHIEGSGNTISGEESHGEGAGNQVHGAKNHGEGGGNNVYGIGSHVEGKHNSIAGFAVHAEGSDNLIGSSTSISQFNYGTDYIVGDIVGPNANYVDFGESSSQYLYRCKTAPGKIQEGNGVEFITASSWSSSTDYPANSVVYFWAQKGCGYYYCSSAVSAQNVPPPVDNSGWTRINSLLSPFKSGTYSGYYLIRADQELSSGISVAKVASDTSIEAMWEPIPTPHSSHVEGLGNISTGDYQHVQGKYNIADSTKAFIIGNGIKDSNNEITRSNALTVDWNGNTAIAGDLTVGAINGTISDLATRIPAAPTTDGTYVLSVTVLNGEPTYSWVAASN